MGRIGEDSKVGKQYTAEDLRAIERISRIFERGLDKMARDLEAEAEKANLRMGIREYIDSINRMHAVRGNAGEDKEDSNGDYVPEEEDEDEDETWSAECRSPQKRPVFREGHGSTHAMIRDVDSEHEENSDEEGLAKAEGNTIEELIAYLSHDIGTPSESEEYDSEDSSLGSARSDEFDEEKRFELVKQSMRKAQRIVRADVLRATQQSTSLSLQGSAWYFYSPVYLDKMIAGDLKVSSEWEEAITEEDRLKDSRFAMGSIKIASAYDFSISSLQSADLSMRWRLSGSLPTCCSTSFHRTAVIGLEEEAYIDCIHVRFISKNRMFFKFKPEYEQDEDDDCQDSMGRGGAKWIEFYGVRQGT